MIFFHKTSLNYGVYPSLSLSQNISKLRIELPLIIKGIRVRFKVFHYLEYFWIGLHV